VEITGSSIKRIDAETALPVQIIGREDIDKSGVTTAAELLKNQRQHGAAVGRRQHHRRHLGPARLQWRQLRGIGVSSTLVLLNGRRLANFASPGDNAGVDLNNIPAGAIQRVEVLKDGASAIYGTDAIGGVINFITRKDYTGVELNASAAGTQEGGAGKRTASIAGGFGKLQEDRFNVFGVLDVQKLDSLRSSQRDFHQERPLAANLPALMSSNTFPANVDISSAQRAALIAAGVLPAGSTANRINPSAPDARRQPRCTLPRARAASWVAATTTWKTPRFIQRPARSVSSAAPPSRPAPTIRSSSNWCSRKRRVIMY
jgi:iron complex outermembrane receptor protein